MRRCKFCNGGTHPVESCLYVKAVEYSDTGSIVRVEKFSPYDYRWRSTDTSWTPCPPGIYSTDSTPRMHA